MQGIVTCIPRRRVVAGSSDHRVEVRHRRPWPRKIRFPRRPVMTSLRCTATSPNKAIYAISQRGPCTPSCVKTFAPRSSTKAAKQISTVRPCLRFSKQHCSIAVGHFVCFATKPSMVTSREFSTNSEIARPILQTFADFLRIFFRLDRSKFLIIFPKCKNCFLYASKKKNFLSP